MTIATLGLLWPRMTFWLEKYRTDRTHFGSVRLTQGGRWQMLFRPMIPLILGLGLTGAGIVTGTEADPQALWLLLPGLPLATYGFVHYRVRSFKILTDHKTADGIGFHAYPRPGRVLRIYLVGGLLIFLVLVVLLFAFVLAVATLVAANVFTDDLFTDLPNLVRSLPNWLTAGFAILFYFSFFIFWGVLTQVFLTLPLMRHYAETLEITGAPRLASVSQRARDDFAEAEGFAEALDVGAAL